MKELIITRTALVLFDFWLYKIRNFWEQLEKPKINVKRMHDAVQSHRVFMQKWQELILYICNITLVRGEWSAS